MERKQNIYKRIIVAYMLELETPLRKGEKVSTSPWAYENFEDQQMFLHKRQTYSNVQTFKKPISNAKHTNLETRLHQNLYLANEVSVI